MMIQEEYNLLFIDLSARLPYGVIMQTCNSMTEKLCSYMDIQYLINLGWKPYLRPMSSMISDEWCEWCDASLEDEKSWVWAGKEYRFTPVTHREEFLNSHYFDYRGLIPMGLALEASEDMYKFD